MSSSYQFNILQLNDDCFYHIYTFLPTVDWCSLRNTCTRFREISDYCFKRQCESFELNAYKVSGTLYDLLSVKDVKHVIRSYGQFIPKLSINRNYFDDEEDPSNLVPFLNRYCLELVDLKFVKINVEPATIMRCDRLFTNLHRLVIDQWNTESLVCCLDRCNSLKELELIRMDYFQGNHLTNNRLECLESFTMSHCIDFNYKCIKQFLFNHSQLTKVKFFSPGFSAGDVMFDIAEALPALAELSVKFNFTFMPNVAHVTKMHSLKTFEIDVVLITDDIVNRLLTGLAQLNNIEDLLLSSFRINETSLGRLCALNTLKILKLTAARHLNGNVCKKIATELPDLTEVHIVECPDTTFNEIKELVAHLGGLTKIVFNRFDQDDLQPSLTQDTFVSLVAARKSKRNKEILLVFLNDDDLTEIHNEFRWGGVSKILIENADVVKLLPLDEVQRRTVFEYGSGFVSRSNAPHDCFSSNGDDDNDLDDDFADAFDDDFDDE